MHAESTGPPADLVSLRVLAHPPRVLPLLAWKALVSTSCWFRIDDDIVKLRWMKPTALTVTKGEHEVAFFHELGTWSARHASTQLLVERDTDLHYFSRFFPFRRAPSAPNGTTEIYANRPPTTEARRALVHCGVSERDATIS